MSTSDVGVVLCAAVAAGCLVPARSRLPAMTQPAAPAASPSKGPGSGDRSLRLLAAVAVSVATAVLVGHVAGLLLAPLAGAACWRWMGTLQPRAERRRRDALTRDLPLVVDLMAACLAVGASPEAALARVVSAARAPMREELSALATRLRLGVDPATVWEELGRHAELGALGRSLARAVRTGASVADAMTRLAEDLRRTARMEMEGRARAVAVKAAAPLGLCLLPAFVLVGVVPLLAGAVARFLAP